MNPGEPLPVLHDTSNRWAHQQFQGDRSAGTAFSQCVCSLRCRMVPRLPSSTDIKVIDLGSATFDEQ